MDRSIPVSNKLISKKIHDRNMQIHQAKLQSMKSSISRQAPQTFSHLKSNKKKIQVHEDKLTEMERQNRILLDKLTHIMKNNNNDHNNANGPKSLNRDMRKRELVKITIENQAFLRRLQDQKSTYDRNLWEHDRKKHELYLKNICEYPFSLMNTTKTPLPNDQRPSTFNLTKEDSFSQPHASPSASQKFHMSSRNFQPPKKQMSTKLDPVTPSAGQKQILYQSKKKIGFSNYLVHIYVHNNVFTIIASNNDRSDFKSFTMPAKDSLELLRQFGDNFDELVNHIKFKGAKIVFDNISFSTDIQNSKDIHNYTSESTTQIAEVHNENEHDQHEHHEYEATHSKDSKEEETDEQGIVDSQNHQEQTGGSQKASSDNQINNAEEAIDSKEQEEEEGLQQEQEVEKQEEQAVENVEEEEAGEENGNNQDDEAHLVPQEKEQEQEMKESIVEDNEKKSQESAEREQNVVAEDREIVSDEVEDNENYKEEFE